MIKSVVTGAEAEELKLLYAAMPTAANRVGETLRKFGMDSEQFKDADANMGKIIRRIREIRGDWGQGP